MAIAIPTQTDVDNGTSVFTKPSGLAVGDLLVLIIANTNSGSIEQWTSEVNQFDPNGNVGIRIKTKIADSGDVAASSFTFTISGSQFSCTGSLLRITGFKNISGALTKASNAIGALNQTSPSLNTTVTPSIADSLLILAAASYQNGNDVGGYAVATDNPSWTELADLRSNVNMQCSIAYAIRVQTTATGNGSMTGGAATADWAMAQLTIGPETQISIADSITMTETEIFDQTILIAESIVMTEDITTSIETPWNYESKGSDISWDYEDK